MNRNPARKRCRPIAPFSCRVSGKSRFGGIVTSGRAMGGYKDTLQADERENGYEA